jgi:hypothetical protein
LPFDQAFVDKCVLIPFPWFLCFNDILLRKQVSGSG